MGFQRGQIEVYRAETNNARPVRIIDFNPVFMKSLEMIVLQRPKNHYYLIMTFTRDMTSNELGTQEENEKMHEDSILNGEKTEVIVKKGGLSFE